MKNLRFTLVFIVLCYNFSKAQTLLNYGYNYGTLPTNINQSDVTSAYTSWKNTFTENCNDGRIRVIFDTPTETVSEGIGYGMLAATFAGDQDLLDGLWNYYNDFLNQNGVMNWKINGCQSVAEYNGATDAELDVALALIIASKRWGNDGSIDYEQDAKDLIQIIKDHEVENGTNVLKPGDVWGGSSTTNISYFAPGYYRAYKEITGDSSWDAVADKSYEIIAANQEKTGAVYNLVSDWCKADGNFSTEVSWARNQGQKYDYDASRTPWRIALDYLWSGNSDALAYANKCIDFINAKNGLNNIYPGYNLDGSAFETSYKDVTFTGAYAVATMASTDQNFVNDAYSKVVEMTTDAYFGSTLRVLYLLTLSGNFYSPDIFSSTLSDIDYNKNEFITFYPNPVANTIHFSNTFSKINHVKIYDINGRTLFENSYDSNEFTIDTSNFKSGIYFLDHNTIKQQFIKK